MDVWYEKTIGYECTIKTPQHTNGEISHWHEQEGTINIELWVFFPKENINGNHRVHFHTKEEFEKYKVK